MEHVTANKDDAEGVSFHHWLSINSPHMLTGLRQWLLALISPSYERQYHLPVIQCEREREVELHVLMWTLSGVISTKFLGAIHSGATDKGLKVCVHFIVVDLDHAESQWLWGLISLL